MTKYYRPLQPPAAPKRPKKPSASPADIKRAAHVGAQRLQREHAAQTAAARERNPR